MAKRKRRKFTEEFKADAVKLVRAGGRSIARVAADRIPTVWVGDARTRAVKRYKGAPVDPRILPAVEERLAVANAQWWR